MRPSAPGFTPFQIDGSGMALPAHCLTSEAMDEALGRPKGWLFRKTGVRQRFTAQTESQIDLAEAAARQALQQADLLAGDISLILFAAAVPYQPIPATAPLLQARLGIGDGACMAFDVNSTCLSFVSALDVAARLIGAGNINGGIGRALIVSAEIASRALPWADDPTTAGLFGDGAAAVVISIGNGESGLVATRMETHASGYEACALPSGGTRFDYHKDRPAFDAHSFFRMDGEALFKLTLKAFEPFLDRLLHEAGWTRNDVDMVIPHQASPGALAHLAKRSGFDASRIINIVETHGNQIAASIPTALHMGRTKGQIGSGQNLLFIGTSAGVSLGGMAVRT